MRNRYDLTFTSSKIVIMIYGATSERAERKLNSLLEQIQHDSMHQGRELNIIQSENNYLETDDYIIRAKKYNESARGNRYHIVYVDELVESYSEEHNVYLRGNIRRTVLNHNQQVYKFKFQEDNI